MARKKARKCNICKLELKECLGHPGVHPFDCDSLYFSEASQKFLRTATFDDYQRFITRKRMENK
jgi:hypothetical protein